MRSRSGRSAFGRRLECNKYLGRSLASIMEMDLVAELQVQAETLRSQAECLQL